MQCKTQGIAILHSINPIKILALHQELVKVLNYLVPRKFKHIFLSRNIKQNRPLLKQLPKKKLTMSRDGANEGSTELYTASLGNT